MAGRRIGAENSATRAQIIAATEVVIREEGYGAASTRRVAQRAGLKPSLVHYYFPTTEDLLLATFAKGAAETDAALDAALAGPDPVRAVWRVMLGTSSNALALEMMALAQHRPAIRAKIAAHVERMRAREVAVMEIATRAGAGTPGACAPAGIPVVLAGIARAISMEGGLGISAGHAEAREWVERCLDFLALDQSRGGTG